MSDWKKQNLNEIEPDNDGNWHNDYRRDVRLTAKNVDMEVYFDKLEQYLITHIRKADVIVGCVAWLTNERILHELQSKQVVSLIVQKEDFLRPDMDSSANRDMWKLKLRGLYSKLKCSITRLEMPGILSAVSVADNPSIEPVRCAGNYNRDKHPAHPRMHHKFMVFCNLHHEPDEYGNKIHPYSVWTGSFNFTHNASSSLENALYINNNKVAMAYYNEYAHVFLLSEPLNWEAEWVYPQFRIGT